MFFLLSMVDHGGATIFLGDFGDVALIGFPSFVTPVSYTSEIDDGILFRDGDVMTGVGSVVVFCRIRGVTKLNILPYSVLLGCKEPDYGFILLCHG